jgi:hypothetical protein
MYEPQAAPTSTPAAEPADPAAAAGADFRWPVVNSGPSWSLPRIAMPGIFSIQWDFQIESWFYAGFVTDSAGRDYSVNLFFGRGEPASGSPPAEQGVSLGAGIGSMTTDSYHMMTVLTLGASDQPAAPAALTIPPATDFSYGIVFEDGSINGSVSYMGSPSEPALGIAGAHYAIGFSVTDQFGAPMSLDITLVDRLGTRMEGSSGYVGPSTPDSEGVYSYEVAQPRLVVTGGSLSVGGETVEIVGGNLWNDRQVYNYAPGLAPKPGSPLYCGCWMPLFFDNGLSMAISAGWSPQPPGEQWLSGRDLGFPPVSGTGNVYFADGANRYNGGALLQTAIEDWDYDINIFDPAEGANSPHFTGPSGITYATAWKVSFGSQLVAWGAPETAWLVAMVPGCEFSTANPPIWEGAVQIYSDPECRNRIGYGFAEQMGYQGTAG